MAYLIHLLTTLSIFGLLSVSLDLLVGYAGLLSLAHGAFFGIGAYSTALLVFNDIPPMLAACFGMGIAATLSALVALPSIRVHGIYLLIVSIAVQIVFTVTAFNWASLTGGAGGISNIPPVALFGHPLHGWKFLLFSLVVCGAAIQLCRILIRTPFGRLIQAIREDETGCLALGKNVAVAKIVLFAFTGALAALAGSLYAHYVSYVDPRSFDIEVSIIVLLMVMLGGAGTLTGPLYGALVLTALPEVLKFIDLPPGNAAAARQALYGFLLVAVIFFRPQGLFGRRAGRAVRSGVKERRA